MPGRAVRHAHRSQVVTAFVRIPGALGDGKVRCLCGKAVGLTKSQRIRAHKTPKGDDCAHRASYADPVKLDRLPDVVIPRERRAPTQNTRVTEAEPSRLEVGSHCEDCAKWIPGERRFCGQCARKRDADRPR